MAGVAGVVLVGLLSGGSLSEILDPSATTVSETTQSVERIFDIRTYPVGIVIAAIFGLAPERLLSRLGEEGESLKSAIDSSEASGSAGAVPEETGLEADEK